MHFFVQHCSSRMDIYEEGDDKDKVEQEKLHQYSAAEHAYGKPF